MNYQWHYDRLIESRKTRCKENNVYYENHHIIPKSMGGTDDVDNLVYLTGREHYIAHWLLWRIHRNKSMANAFWNMQSGCKNQSQRKGFSSIGYAEAKEAWIKSNDFSGTNNGMYGKKHSVETKEKIRLSALSRTSKNGMKNRNHTPESIEKMKINRSGTRLSDEHRHKISERHTGKTVSVETREKMGAWQRGRILSKETRLRMSEAAKNRKKSND